MVPPVQAHPEDQGPRCHLAALQGPGVPALPPDQAALLDPGPRADLGPLKVPVLPGLQQYRDCRLFRVVHQVPAVPWVLGDPADRGYLRDPGVLVLPADLGLHSLPEALERPQTPAVPGYLHHPAPLRALYHLLGLADQDLRDYRRVLRDQADLRLLGLPGLQADLAPRTLPVSLVSRPDPEFRGYLSVPEVPPLQRYPGDQDFQAPRDLLHCLLVLEYQGPLQPPGSLRPPADRSLPSVPSRR